ncbi:MAG: VOC family protein [Opitutaceae bacterium]
MPLAPVLLRVARLASSVAFYTGQLGFVVSHATPTQVSLAPTPVFRRSSR